MRPAIRLAVAALVLTPLVAPARAWAVEVPNVGGKPLTLDITNTSVLNYHFDNRNDTILDFGKQADDNYGEWLDRLNVQASWWRLRLGVRLDSAIFFHTLSRADVAAMAADRKAALDAAAQATGRDPREYANDVYVNGLESDLHTRYRRAIYPSKLFAGYSARGIDVTVGDFYVQLGRGLVFSVRKIDELAVDTTVRGGKVVADHDFGAVRLSGTLFAGQMNPLRVDETSGRRLNGTGSPLFFGFPTAGDLQLYDLSKAGTVAEKSFAARPSYLEDTAAGARVELGTNWFSVAANGAMLLREPATRFPGFVVTDPSKAHDRILNWSGSVNVPSIAKHADVYLEVAGQRMESGYAASVKDLSGYAVYASAGVTGGPVAISLEGKHYRDFFPLSAHIDTQSAGFGAPELGLVTYSQPPTAEPIYTEVVRGGSPSVCVTGGRARIDYRFQRATSVYAWVGRYASWSEIPLPLDNGCSVDRDHQTNTWDAAVGGELAFEHGKSHVKAWVGSRTTDYATMTNATAGTPTFYHEGYVRYDIIKHIRGPFSLQLQGFHRRRHEPIELHDNAWIEGENYTALQWSPHLSAVFGYEYLVKDECQPGRAATLSQPERAAKNVCHFLNGGVQWRSAGAGQGAAKVFGQLFDTVAVFVGQRRGAIRCVSGTCRQFPPFEGAKLEITSRF